MDDEPVVDENTIDISSGVEYDTISIDTSSMNSYNYSYSNIPPSVTISGSSNNYGAIGSSGSFLTSNGLNGTSWSNNWVTSSNPSSLNVKGDAEFDGDVKIQGHSILKLLKSIEDRLAILQEPSPEKLEKYAALKKAYDHYKTLERLIGED